MLCPGISSQLDLLIQPPQGTSNGSFQFKALLSADQLTYSGSGYSGLVSSSPSHSDMKSALLLWLYSVQQLGTNPEVKIHCFPIEYHSLTLGRLLTPIPAASHLAAKPLTTRFRSRSSEESKSTSSAKSFDVVLRSLDWTPLLKRFTINHRRNVFTNPHVTYQLPHHCFFLLHLKD